jgi:hypothetical protein
MRRALGRAANECSPYLKTTVKMAHSQYPENTYAQDGFKVRKVRGEREENERS